MEVLNPADYRILLAERTGAQLRSLGNADLQDTIVDIMSEVKLVTGAVVYEGDMMLAQVEMIRRFLAGGFGLLTKEEIIGAFYLNAQGRFDEVYRHYNKELNAEFVGDVLRAYMRYKRQVKDWNGSKLQQVFAPNQIRKAPLKVDWSFWKEQIQKEYAAYVIGEPCLQLWHARKYYALRKYGRLSFRGIETWEWFMKKAIETGDYSTTLNGNLWHYKFRSAGEIRRIFQNRNEFEKCLDYARRYAYWYILRTFKSTGIHNIWTEIQS